MLTRAICSFISIQAAFTGTKAGKLIRSPQWGLIRKLSIYSVGKQSKLARSKWPQSKRVKNRRYKAMRIQIVFAGVALNGTGQFSGCAATAFRGSPMRARILGR